MGEGDYAGGRGRGGPALGGLGRLRGDLRDASLWVSDLGCGPNLLRLGLCEESISYRQAEQASRWRPTAPLAIVRRTPCERAGRRLQPTARDGKQLRLPPILLDQEYVVDRTNAGPSSNGSTDANSTTESSASESRMATTAGP